MRRACWQASNPQAPDDPPRTRQTAAARPDAVVSADVDELPELVGGLDGCQAGALINTIPTEMDCNAAASVYINERFSAAEVQAIRDSDRRALACSLVPPPPPETLPARMVAFAFVHRSAVEAHAARRGFSVAPILGMYSASPLWTRLEQGL